MQEFPDFVPAFSHDFKPLMRDSSQFTSMFVHPRINGGIALDGAIESQEFRFHDLRLSAFENRSYEASLLYVPQNRLSGMRIRLSLIASTIPTLAMPRQSRC